jgi:hypothetical protein
VILTTEGRRQCTRIVKLGALKTTARACFPALDLFPGQPPRLAASVFVLGYSEPVLCGSPKQKLGVYNN